MFPKFELFGSIIYSYPLIIGAIWAIGYEYAKALNKNLKHFNFLFLSLFLASWVGAKTLFLLTLDKEVTTKLVDSSNFWMGGGFVFLGGLIGGGVILMMHKLWTKQPLADYQFLILPLVLGHGIGRVACFMAGCCYGNSCDLPWAIHLHGLDRHPVQLYEAGSLFILYLFLRKRWKNNKNIIMPYLAAYFVLRFILEFFRGDSIRGVYALGLSTSQIIGLLGITALAAVHNLLDKPRT